VTSKTRGLFSYGGGGDKTASKCSLMTNVIQSHSSYQAEGQGHVMSTNTHTIHEWITGTRNPRVNPANKVRF